jgi:endonuclease/exonuclease/phosphatase family metal-dependent hydrolase
MKNLSLFFKILIVGFVVSVLTLAAGRSHFILGTVFILLRWILFGIALCLLYLASKRTSSKHYKVALIVVLVTIPVEYSWNELWKRSLKSGQTTTEVSLMTYNIFFKNWSTNSSIKRIEDYDPDILFLQELTPELKNEMDNSIGSNYRYKKTLALKGTHGIGVYSKYPILRSEFLKNSADQPFAQVLELEIKSKKIRIYNVHLASPAIAVENPDNFIELFGSNYQGRTQQLSMINTLADEEESEFDAQLLTGDLNTTSYEPLYRDIEKQWVNLYDVAGDGLGLNFPHTNKMDPILTLDYLFGRGVIEGIKIRVVEGGGSDHLPIAGKIKF